MSVDLTDVFERVSTPPMGIDPQSVLVGGQRRLRRRRAVKVASSLAVLVAVAVTAPAVAGRAPGPSLSPAAPSTASGDVLLPAPQRMDFEQTGTDGRVRAYRIVASPNHQLGRNEAKLYVLDASNRPALIGAVAVSHPERGPVKGATDTPARGLVWGIGRVSGNTRANYTLQDGTSFSVPIRRFTGTPWELSVIDGLTLAQRAQTGSVTDDRGVPSLR